MSIAGLDCASAGGSKSRTRDLAFWRLDESRYLPARPTGVIGRPVFPNAGAARVGCHSARDPKQKAAFSQAKDQPQQQRVEKESAPQLAMEERERKKAEEVRSHAKKAPVRGSRPPAN